MDIIYILWIFFFFFVTNEAKVDLSNVLNLIVFVSFHFRVQLKLNMLLYRIQINLLFIFFVNQSITEI